MINADTSITIAIISRQHMVRLGLQKIFESRKNIRVVGQPHHRITSHELLNRDRPDVIVLDTETEGDIIGNLTHIRETSPKSKVVLLCGFEDMDRVREGIEYGVDGVILKIHPPAVVLAVIETLYTATDHPHSKTGDDAAQFGRTEILTSKAITESRSAAWPDALTEREREVIRLVGQGLSNKDIAYQLSISDSTVRHHLTSIFDKVGVPNRQKLLIHTHHFRTTPV